MCRTARLGGHVQQCQDCAAFRIACNSCRNRHCPKCKGHASRDWLAARQAHLLPVGYFHVVFTVPQEIAAITFQNKAALYAILFRAVAETLRKLAADPRHLGAEIGFIAVLHSWGQNLHYHPHIHCIVPGGGLSADQSRWGAFRPNFFLPVRVLSRLFRRLLLEGPAPTSILRRYCRSGRSGRLQSNHQSSASHRLGGLCQAAICRTRTGAGLSWPLPIALPSPIPDLSGSIAIRSLSVERIIERAGPKR